MTNRQEASNRSNVVAGMVGNTLEWYDFAVYGFLAPILGRRFFPADYPVASLLAAFSVFAIGYLMRPIGGAIFGHIGDKFGRKPSLLLSITAMGLTTTSIGILPDHAQIGIFATVLLVILRMLQGLSVGGEYTSSIVFVAEHAPNLRRGLLTGWIQFGCFAGFLLGSATGALTSNVINQQAMDNWGWRVPFLLGGVIAVCGLFVRRHLTESPVMSTLQEKLRSPVKVVIRRHWRLIVRVVLLVLPSGMGFNLLFFYAPSYLTEALHMTTSRALDINTLGLLALLATTLPAAMLSDYLGRKPLWYFLTLGLVLFSWPLWWLMHEDRFFLNLAGHVGFAFLLGTGLAAMPAMLAEIFPAEVRCSGVSIAFNLCIGLFGGTAPLIATYLVERTANDMAPVYYIMASGVVSFVVALRLPETARQDMI